jgi:hypothetical protein
MRARSRNGVYSQPLCCSRAGYGEFRIVFIGGRKIAEHFAGERNFDRNGCRFVRSRYPCGEMRRCFPSEASHLKIITSCAMRVESRPEALPGGAVATYKERPDVRGCRISWCD